MYPTGRKLIFIFNPNFWDVRGCSVLWEGQEGYFIPNYPSLRSFCCLFFALLTAKMHECNYHIFMGSFRLEKTLKMESNQNPTLPSAALNHVPGCHIQVRPLNILITSDKEL